MGQHTGARLPVHLKDVLHRYELTDGRGLRIATDNAFSYNSMTRDLQWLLEDSGMEWPALSNHIRCIAHFIQLALGAFISSLSVKGPTKSWESHEHTQQFGDNERIDIGKSQRLQKEGNAWIKNVLAMRPGSAKIIEKVHTSRYIESPETDHDKAVNASCIDYSNTWSLKWVLWQSKCQSLHCSTSAYGFEDTLQLNTVVASASLPITRIHSWVAPAFQTQQLPATLHNTGRMDHCQVYDGSI
jgi:hypothetical protein